jgi:hypothetical protein
LLLILLLDGFPVALVLCTGIDETLIITRKMILERGGHKVVPALGLSELVTVCSEHTFEVAVIGQMGSPEQKREFINIIRGHCPTAKVLELYRSSDEHTLADADDWLEVPARVPTDLEERVRALAGKAK